MIKIKRNKKLMIPVLAMMIIVAMAGSAFATSSVARITGTNGIDYGEPKIMSGTIRRSAILDDDSTSQYITTYVKYGTSNWQFPRTVENGKSYVNKYDTLPSGYHAVQAVLEAIWGTNIASHYVYDD